MRRLKEIGDYLLDETDFLGKGSYANVHIIY